MTSDAATPPDSNPSSDLPVEHVAPVPRPRDADVDVPRVVYHPLPVANATAREQRALRRMGRRRTVPSWARQLSKFKWIPLPTYGLMRLHDEDYEEHYEQWRQERRNDDGRDPR